MPLVKTKGGRTNLHVWRGGRSYESQKGGIYRREWNNILFERSPRQRKDDDILSFDIRKPLPYPDEIFDAVYLLHVVEHLTPSEGESLLRQVYRTLKPSGIVRVSTPDLEDSCRAYLKCLEDYDRNPINNNLIKYEWSVLELLDQIVRVTSGGLMVEYKKNGYYDPSYAVERYRDVFDEFYIPPPSSPKKSPDDLPRKTLNQRLRQLTMKTFAKGIHRRVKEMFNKLCDNRTEESLYDPRASGEVNKWLYDHLSLTMLLQETGFHRISPKTFRTSDIPEWDRFDLDRSNFGDHAVEPSLYIEAFRP